MEVKGVRSSRIQNLAVSLDKIKHFLKKQSANDKQIVDLSNAPAPMTFLTDDEILDYLWFSESSVMRRVFQSGWAYCGGDDDENEYLKKSIENENNISSTKEYDDDEYNDDEAIKGGKGEGSTLNPKLVFLRLKEELAKETYYRNNPSQIREFIANCMFITIINNEYNCHYSLSFHSFYTISRITQSYILSNFI